MQLFGNGFMFGYLFSVIKFSIMLIPYACNAVLVCRNLVFNNSGRSGQKRIIAFLGQIPPPRWVRTAIVLLLAINIVSWAKLLMMSCCFSCSLCSSPARISRLEDPVFNQGKILGFFRRVQVIWWRNSEDWDEKF